MVNNDIWNYIKLIFWSFLVSTCLIGLIVLLLKILFANWKMILTKNSISMEKINRKYNKDTENNYFRLEESLKMIIEKIRKYINEIIKDKKNKPK